MSFYLKGCWMQKKHGKKIFKIDKKKEIINEIAENQKLLVVVPSRDELNNRIPNKRRYKLNRGVANRQCL